MKISIGQAISPNKDINASALASVDSDGMATLPNCGDSTFARYDKKTGIAAAGVFDGVGSTLDTRKIKGDVLSSQTACHAVSRNLSELDESQIIGQLYYSAFQAHVDLNRASVENSLVLSTTATYGVIFPNGNAYILNSGDSRGNLFDGNNLQMLTLDDRSFSTMNGLHESVKSLYASLIDGSDGTADMERVLQGFQTPDEFWEFFNKKITFRDVSELRLLLDFQEYFSNLKIKNLDEATDTSVREFGIFKTGIINNGNKISRSISSHSVPRISITKVHLNEGDILLLFTDGLHDVLPTDEIRDVVNYWKTSKASIIAMMLVDHTREVLREGKYHYSRGKHDDIGVAVVKWGEKD